MKYIYERRALSHFEDSKIYLSSITFLNDVSKDYINCLQRIYYHKQKIHEVRGRLTIYQSYQLENLRCILEDIMISKQFKHSELILHLDSKKAVHYHAKIERIKEDMKIFSFMLKSFYSLLLRKNFDLGVALASVRELSAKKRALDKAYKQLLEVYRMNRELLVNYYYYKHFLLFDDMGLKEYEENLKTCFKLGSGVRVSMDGKKPSFSKFENLNSDSFVIMLKVT